MVGGAAIHLPGEEQQQQPQQVGDEVEVLNQLNADDDRHAAHRQRQHDSPEQQNPALRRRHCEVAEDQQEDDKVVERQGPLNQIDGDVVNAVSWRQD